MKISLDGRLKSIIHDLFAETQIQEKFIIYILLNRMFFFTQCFTISIFTYTKTDFLYCKI